MKDKAIQEVLAPQDEARQRENERRVREGFWAKFRAFASRLPFAEDVVAAYYCALDSKTPLKVRATLFAALAYFIVPFDFVPDMLLLVGLGDDIAVLMAAFTMVRGAITEEHREKARHALSQKAQSVG